MKKLLLLLFVFILVSCNKAAVYTETSENFANNRWIASDVKEFNFSLKEDLAAGEIKITLSHVFEPGFAAVPAEIMIEGPGGEAETIPFDFMFKDAQGNDLSDCMGDVCDLHTTVKKGKLLKGDYKITLQNKFPNTFVPNVLAVGVSVEKAN